MATQPKDPRKLNLDAPLLSTRQATGSDTHPSSRGPSWDSRNRIPFSWELTAGKPKDTRTRFDVDGTVRVPPGRKLMENEYDGDDDHSDAGDTFSLTSAIDMVESREMAKQNGNMTDGMELDSRGNESPGFIIQRFLSDAKVLAVLSGLPIPKSISKQGDRCKPQMVNSSSKGCGLGLPWGTKTKLKPKQKTPCGVRVTSASVKFHKKISGVGILDD